MAAPALRCKIMHTLGVQVCAFLPVGVCELAMGSSKGSRGAEGQSVQESSVNSFLWMIPRSLLMSETHCTMI